jgi:hypothetical protein
MELFWSIQADESTPVIGLELSAPMTGSGATHLAFNSMGAAYFRDGDMPSTCDWIASAH